MTLFKKSAILLSILGTIFLGTGAFAQQTPIDIEIKASLVGGGTGVAQNSVPSLDVFLINTGSQGILGTAIDPGFLSCTWEGKIIYETRKIPSLIINKGTRIKKTIVLNDSVTKSVGDKSIKCSLINREGKETNITNNSVQVEFIVEEAGRFDLSLNRAISPIKNNLDAAELKDGIDGVKDFLINKVMAILVPVIILLGILVSILGFYKIFFATDDKAVENGIKLITFGAAGIILIMSAKFFASTISGSIFNNGELGYGAVQGYDLAQKLYEQLFFPFIKIGIYLSLGVLFVMLAARVVTFIFGSDDDTKKKAGTIITWNVVGMLIIIGSKQLVEFVYGKQAEVVKSVSNLGEIGTGLLASKNFPFLYEVINRAMGLASLLILIMILFQAFQLLMKPDAPDAMKKIKNSLLYIFIGILVIGTGYIITNFLIIN